MLSCIMDNATIHKSEELRKVIEKSSSRILFRPAYLPDLSLLKSFGQFQEKDLLNLRVRSKP